MDNSNTIDNADIDLDDISNSFRSIENSIAKYIYKKYIMYKPPQNIRESTMNEDTVCEDIEGIGNEEIPNEDKNYILDNQLKINQTINQTINTKLYKLYLQKIFDLERHSFRILQDDVLKDDLKNMAIADKAYNINPKNFNPKDYNSLPDVLRCTYIRKYKHRYYRCHNKIINDDNDICKKHENCENIYIDKYNELLEQYQNN